MMSSLRSGLLLLLITCFAIGVPLSASAQQILHDAKLANQAGEKFDGFVGLIDPSASALVKKVVEQTNKSRKERYQKVATKRGATLESVGKRAAAILFKRAAKGEMLQTADGKWKKKQ